MSWSILQRRMEVSTCQPDSTREAIDGSRERDGKDVEQERGGRESTSETNNRLSRNAKKTKNLERV